MPLLLNLMLRFALFKNIGTKFIGLKCFCTEHMQHIPNNNN